MTIYPLMKELKFQLGNLKSNGNCFPNAQKKELKKNSFGKPYPVYYKRTSYNHQLMENSQKYPVLIELLIIFVSTLCSW